MPHGRRHGKPAGTVRRVHDRGGAVGGLWVALVLDRATNIDEVVGKHASAFFESVFNRAAARCQTVKRAADDADYYPRVSIRGKPYSKRDEAMFGEALRRVREGSNISRLATGNASGHVGFAGGPQTYAPGTGERYGIEGPDVEGVKDSGFRGGA